jgi:hypothetical protein
MSDLKSEIAIAHTFRERVGQLVSGEYDSATRTMLLVAFADQIFEHHQAVLYLIEQRLTGSAFALVRSLIEAFFKVQWAVACASDQQVEQIGTKKRFEFPGTEDMVKEIDQKLQTEGFFLDFKKNAWAAMNSYTHTGLLQLSRRFSGDRVQPRYDDTECIEVVRVSTTSIVLLGRFFSVVTGRAAEAEKAEELMQEYAES